MRRQTTTALVVAAVAVVASGFVTREAVDAGVRYRERPDSTRMSDWPRHLPARPGFNGYRVAVAAGALNAGDDVSFRWDVGAPRDAARSTWIYVQCDTGTIHISGPGDNVSRPCDGLNGTVGGIMADLDHMHVRVSEPQRHRWGVAIYR